MLAKRGAVGGAARWAAKGYFALIDRKPAASLNEVLQFLVHARYGMDAKDHESIILEKLQTNEIRGIAHLVTMFLTAEAGYADNSEENKAIFRDVIFEELESRNVPPEFIHSVRS